MSPDEPSPEDGNEELLRAATELAEAAAYEREEIVRLLGAIVDGQAHLAEVLAEVAEAVDELRDAHVEKRPAGSPDLRASEALRRESRQTARHTEQLLADMRALLGRMPGVDGDGDGDGDGHR